MTPFSRSRHQPSTWSLYGKDNLRKGSVVTIEPGLYEPKWGGIRIEDIVVVGSPSENITPLSKDIEL